MAQRRMSPADMALAELVASGTYPEYVEPSQPARPVVLRRGYDDYVPAGSPVVRGRVPYSTPVMSTTIGGSVGPLVRANSEDPLVVWAPRATGAEDILNTFLNRPTRNPDPAVFDMLGKLMTMAAKGGTGAGGGGGTGSPSGNAKGTPAEPAPGDIPNGNPMADFHAGMYPPADVPQKPQAPQPPAPRGAGTGGGGGGGGGAGAGSHAQPRHDPMENDFYRGIERPWGGVGHDTSLSDVMGYAAAGLTMLPMFRAFKWLRPMAKVAPKVAPKVTPKAPPAGALSHVSRNMNRNGGVTTMNRGSGVGPTGQTRFRYTPPSRLRKP